jgi:hypothetical protein
MRRAPQLWEQRLARTTAILGAGISSSGDATAIVPPSSPPGAGGGTEPAPVAPAPGLFIAPSAPTLIGSVQGINVVWNGLNSAGDLWPSDTSYVEVHMSTAGTGFTPDSSTLKGRLVRPGGLAVVGLTAGTTYHFRLRGADPAGNFTSAGAAASGTPGLINAPDIAANAITANSIVAGTITGWSINSAYLSGGTVSGGFITGGTVSGGFITGGTVSGGYISGGTMNAGFISGGTVSGGYISGGTVQGAMFETRAGGARIKISDAISGPYGTFDAIEFFEGSTSRSLISYVQAENQLDFYSAKFGFDDRNGDGTVEVTVYGDIEITDVLDVGFSDGERAFRVAGDGKVFSNGIDNNTTANAANVRVGASAQLLRSTSTVRLKDDLAPLDDDLTGVPADKLSTDPASVDPYDVLTLTPTEFRSLSPADGDARSLGFIAEDVAAKLPWAADWDEDGLPSAVEDRPILAALVAVVKAQQATIVDLGARVAALEAGT